MEKMEYRELPIRGNHNCFGCSPTNPVGLRMRFFTDGEALYSRLTIPEHLCGWGNIVHGGIQSTILDETMGWTALHLLKKFTLTKSMTVEFLKPVYVGDELRVEGRIAEIKRSREAVLKGFLYDSRGELCSWATAVFGLFTASAIRKLKIMDEEVLKSVEHLVEG